MSGQLIASPREPTFVFVCVYCGQPYDLVEVEAGEKWSAATAWGYLAQKKHEETCPRIVQQLELPGFWWWDP